MSGLQSPLRFKFLASSSSTSWRKRSAFNGLTWLGQASLDTFPHIKVNRATQHNLITGVDSIGVSVPGSHKGIPGAVLTFGRTGSSLLRVGFL